MGKPSDFYYIKISQGFIFYFIFQNFLLFPLFTIIQPISIIIFTLTVILFEK